MSLDKPVPAASNKDVEVAERISFPQSRWREAILFYLFGIWGNLKSVTKCPKIRFGGITLRLRDDGEYYAYGQMEIPEEVPALGEHDLVAESDREHDVEIALIRFVKDDQIMQLRLRLWTLQDEPDVSVLVLWKKEKRGQYGVAGLNLPCSFVSDEPVWTRGEFERLKR